MFIHEFGNRDDPTVILLAPMMVSGTDLYALMSPHFNGTYHFIAPDQGGHGKAGAYTSADEEYRELKGFLLETGCTRIELVYGASLDVAVGYRLFLDPVFSVTHGDHDRVGLETGHPVAEHRRENTRDTVQPNDASGHCREPAGAPTMAAEPARSWYRIFWARAGADSRTDAAESDGEFGRG